MIIAFDYNFARKSYPVEVRTGNDKQSLRTEPEIYLGTHEIYDLLSDATKVEILSEALKESTRYGGPR